MDSAKREVANRNPTFGGFPLNDAASSSSALAAPCGVSVPAKRASEEQTEWPAIETGVQISFGTVNTKDPCDVPNATGYSNEPWILDPEVLEAVFSNKGVMVGGHFCHYLVGVGNLKKDEAEINLVERLREPVIEADEIKPERPGSDSEDWKKRYYDVKKRYDDEKEIYDLTVVLREVLSNFGEKPEGKIVDDKIKEEVLKLPAAKIEKIVMILENASYTKTLRTMHFQRANMTLISSFWSIDRRKDYRFPRFSNDSAEYQWWEQNFDPVILEKRMEIFREAAKNWNPRLDMFMIIELVSDLNSRLHPQPSENKLHEKDEDKMSRLLTRIRHLRSGGDGKI